MIEELIAEFFPTFSAWLNPRPRYVHPSLRRPPRTYEPLPPAAIALGKKAYLGPKRNRHIA